MVHTTNSCSSRDIPSDLNSPDSSGLDLDTPFQQAAFDGEVSAEELPEFIRLFYAVEALRTGDKVLVLQFAGVVGSEGVTTVASGFARVAAREYGRPVLFVDCTLPSPSGRASRAPRLRWHARRTGLLLPHTGNLKNLQVTKLSSGLTSGGRGASADTKMHLDSYRDHYGLVILDSPAVTVAPHAAALSRLCDGTILVVQAEKTSMRAIKAAQVSVERLGGQVVGLVFNRARQRLPAWLTRRFLT